MSNDSGLLSHWSSLALLWIRAAYKQRQCADVCYPTARKQQNAAYCNRRSDVTISNALPASSSSMKPAVENTFCSHQRLRRIWSIYFRAIVETTPKSSTLSNWLWEYRTTIQTRRQHQNRSNLAGSVTTAMYSIWSLLLRSKRSSSSYISYTEKKYRYPSLRPFVIRPYCFTRFQPVTFCDTWLHNDTFCAMKEASYSEFQ